MTEATEIADPWTLSIEDIDVSDPRIYQQDAWGSYFRRLREEAPVHYQAHSAIQRTPTTQTRIQSIDYNYTWRPNPGSIPVLAHSRKHKIE